MFASRSQVTYDKEVLVAKRTGMLLFLITLATAAPFTSGTRFGMAGLDLRPMFGSLYNSYNQTHLGLVDPVFRAGVCVWPNLAFGAEVALFNTFPLEGDIFTSTPVFIFGPNATYFFKLAPGDILPYATAGAGANYAFMPRMLGWRWKLGAGALVASGSSLAFGIEAGWFEDWSREVYWRGQQFALIWRQGDAGFIGIRIMGVK